MGLNVLSNSFNYNFGCPKYGGPLMAFQCNENITNIIPDNAHSNMDLMDDQKDEKRKVFKNYTKYDNSKVPDDLGLSFVTESGNAVAVPKYKNLMRNNVFYRNYGGFGEGLIDIKGFVRFYMIKDTYLNNGENIVEITNFLRENYNPFISSEILRNSSIYTSFSVDVYSANITIDNSYVFYQPSEAYLMKSLVHYSYGSYLHLEGLNFSQNFMYEPDYSKTRGMILYGEVFFGTLNITGVNI